MKFRKSFFLSVGLAVLIAWPSISVSQQGPRWTSNYLKAEKADELSVCIAIVAYTNASFMARLYGERIDFLYRRNDFTLPFDQVLGFVTFVIDGQVYRVSASTFAKSASDLNRTAQVMQLIPREDENAALFSALRYGTSFEVIFPNGDAYPVTLSGSSDALAAASNCWDRNFTGPLENNPFNSGDEGIGDSTGASNPFDDT